MKNEKISRREFLQLAVAGGVAVTPLPGLLNKELASDGRVEVSVDNYNPKEGSVGNWQNISPESETVSMLHEGRITITTYPEYSLNVLNIKPISDKHGESLSLRLNDPVEIEKWVGLQIAGSQGTFINDEMLHGLQSLRVVMPVASLSTTGKAESYETLGVSLRYDKGSEEESNDDRWQVAEWYPDKEEESAGIVPPQEVGQVSNADNGQCVIGLVAGAALVGGAAAIRSIKRAGSDENGVDQGSGIVESNKATKHESPSDSQRDFPQEREGYIRNEMAPMYDLLKRGIVTTEEIKVLQDASQQSTSNLYVRKNQLLEVKRKQGLIRYRT